MHQLFGYISGILITLEFLPYIRDILRLKTKPQRTTWFLFFILGGIAFFSQLAKGASDSLWLPGIITIGVTIIFLLSLKYGVGGLQKKDYFVLLFAFLGLIAWYFTKEPAVALYIVILIDAAGTYLTAEKAYHHPESETILLWIFSSVAGFFAMLAVGKWDIILLSYPFFIFLADAAIVSAICLGKRKRKRTNI